MFSVGSNDFFNTTLSGAINGSTNITWNSQGVGIEEFVGNVVVLPTSGNPYVGVWDKGIWLPNTSTYPATWLPTADAKVVAGWSVDYANSNPSFIGIAADGVTSAQ